MATTSTGGGETTTGEATEPVADPDSKSSTGCTMHLGAGTGFSSEGGEPPAEPGGSIHGLLGAKARIRNTGNVGIVVRVRGTWDRTGFPPYKVVKKTRVEVGRDKTVYLRMSITPNRTAEVQATRKEPGSFCRVKVSIIDTFGQPQ